jgi:hypothetical protein
MIRPPPSRHRISAPGQLSCDRQPSLAPAWQPPAARARPCPTRGTCSLRTPKARADRSALPQKAKAAAVLQSFSCHSRCRITDGTKDARKRPVASITLSDSRHGGALAAGSHSPTSPCTLTARISPWSWEPAAGPGEPVAGRAWRRSPVRPGRPCPGKAREPPACQPGCMPGSAVHLHPKRRQRGRPWRSAGTPTVHTDRHNCAHRPS